MSTYSPWCFQRYQGRKFFNTVLLEHQPTEHFLDKKKSVSVPGPGQEGIEVKNCFGMIKDLPLWFFWKPAIILKPKLQWVYNGLKLIFERFFRIYDSKSTTCLNWVVSSLVQPNKYYCLKRPIFPCSKSEALRLGVHLILYYFITISLLTPETCFILVVGCAWSTFFFL